MIVLGPEFVFPEKGPDPLHCFLKRNGFCFQVGVTGDAWLLTPHQASGMDGRDKGIRVTTLGLEAKDGSFFDLCYTRLNVATPSSR